METMHKEEVASNSLEAHGSVMDECDPWNPPCPPRRLTPPGIDMHAHVELIDQWYDDIHKVIATSRRTKIIIPDRTPKAVDGHLWDVLPQLVPILDEDSVPHFLDLFNRADGGLAWGFIITPLTLTQMVKQNALQCAKVALVGKAPKLHGFRANPNCMNRYGYFPLHEAAEMFSVDMIKLLLRYNASANVRTAGAQVIEGLLPLHVAVENTCLHKYLEDNAFFNQGDLNNNQANVNYVCKIIHLLCLPEMKIFLDTIRLLGERTDNLIDELWNYIEEGSFIQSAVLILATQKQIRGCLSSSKNGKCKLDGFHVIINRILSYIARLESGETGKEKLEVEKSKNSASAALMLVHAVSQAGEALDAYIQSHPEMPYDVQIPRSEMIRHVSSILKNNGFCPTEGNVDLGNISHCEHIFSEEVSPNNCGHTVVKATPGTLCPHSKAEQVVRNGMPRGWEIEYVRKYFPYWRGVLKSKSPVKVIPVVHFPTIEEIKNSRKKSGNQGSPLIQDFNPGLIERFKKFSNQQKRTFCSVAFPLLKVLRKA